MDLIWRKKPATVGRARGLLPAFRQRGNDAEIRRRAKQDTEAEDSEAV